MGIPVPIIKQVGGYSFVNSLWRTFTLSNIFCNIAQQYLIMAFTTDKIVVNEGLNDINEVV